MCGICGIVSFDGDRTNEQVVRMMCSHLTHRGPDAEGIHVAPGIGLGQRRLSVIDLAARATPPLSNEDGSLWLVFNGEIYGYWLLRDELIRKGHQFKTESDTEVILHLYEEEGVDCLDRLRGMFAFALWDAKHRILFAARDRLGKKPFCYWTHTGRLVFGSELRAVTAHPLVPSRPDWYAIDQYLTWQYVPSPLTAFEGISKLPAGHYLVFHPERGLKVERYWQTPLGQSDSMTESELDEGVLKRLREAVRLRMVADVSTGVFLSGGIDSGLVTALMAESSARPIKTFTIGYPEAECDERPYARSVAERYGTEHHEFELSPITPELLERMVDHYGEPFADSSAYPCWCISEQTRQHVTVALSGDGGDETFGGYDHYRAQLKWAMVDAVPLVMRAWIGGVSASALMRWSVNWRTAKLNRAFQSLSAGMAGRYALHLQCLKPEERHALYTADFRAAVSEQSRQFEAPGTLALELGEESLAWMMRHDQRHYLPDCLMAKMDIASMAHGLEVRSPFLDQELVEFAALIPGHRKIRGNVGKVILRRLAREFLPAEVTSKKKTGFGIPAARWLAGPLRGVLGQTLLGDESAGTPLFRRKVLQRMVSEHESGERDWSNRLWALVCLQVWLRRRGGL